MIQNVKIQTGLPSQSIRYNGLSSDSYQDLQFYHLLNLQYNIELSTICRLQCNVYEKTFCPEILQLIQFSIEESLAVLCRNPPPQASCTHTQYTKRHSTDVLYVQPQHNTQYISLSSTPNVSTIISNFSETPLPNSINVYFDVE